MFDRQCRSLPSSLNLSVFFCLFSFFFRIFSLSFSIYFLGLFVNLFLLSENLFYALLSFFTLPIFGWRKCRWADLCWNCCLPVTRGYTWPSCKSSPAHTVFTTSNWVIFFLSLPYDICSTLGSQFRGHSLDLPHFLIHAHRYLSPSVLLLHSSIFVLSCLSFCCPFAVFLSVSPSFFFFVELFALWRGGYVSPLCSVTGQKIRLDWHIVEKETFYCCRSSAVDLAHNTHTWLP